MQITGITASELLQRLLKHDASFLLHDSAFPCLFGIIAEAYDRIATLEARITELEKQK